MFMKGTKHGNARKKGEGNEPKFSLFVQKKKRLSSVG